MRALISEDKIAAGRDVLEIGTGAGVMAALCLSYDAKSVVATDSNPAAIANAKYNAAAIELDDQLDARLNETDAAISFAQIRPSERFGLIIVNATNESETQRMESIIESMLDQLPKHQKSGGRCLISSDTREQIEQWKAESERRGYEFKILTDRVRGDRTLESMDHHVFPPALLEIRVPIDQLQEIE